MFALPSQPNPAPMMISRAILSLFFLCAFCFAQNPAEPAEKPPPAVDEALRARIGTFYQAHVDGKFSNAFNLVAEESKEDFFAAQKERYKDYSIMTIEYSENFTRAKAVVACGKDVAALGTTFPVKAPIVSHWKLIDGQWYWYKVKTTGNVTPFGVMSPGPQAQNAAAVAKRAPMVRSLQKLAVVDKTEVKLKASEASSDQVIVSNSLPGVVSLSVDYRGDPGLEVTLDRQDLRPQEKATMSFRWNPSRMPKKATTVARLIISPTNQIIPIKVIFEGVPESSKPQSRRPLPPRMKIVPPPKPEAQTPAAK